MRVSDEFFDFCSALHQDADLYGPEPQDWIYGALGAVNKDNLPAFRDYLNELLASDLSDAEIKELMRSTYADISFTRGIRYFFGMVRDTIDENLRPGAPDRIELASQALLRRLREEDGHAGP